MMVEIELKEYQKRKRLRVEGNQACLIVVWMTILLEIVPLKMAQGTVFLLTLQGGRTLNLMELGMHIISSVSKCL